MRRAFVYAVLSSVLLTVYGTEVCPLLDGLPRWRLLLTILAALGCMLAARPRLLSRYVDSVPPEQQVRRQLPIDLGSFAAVGVGLTIYNHTAYDFPVASGMKLLLGCTLLGIFYAPD